MVLCQVSFKKTPGARVAAAHCGAPCSLTSQISLIVVVARTTLVIAIAVVALTVALIAALIALAQIFELEVCL